MRVTEALGGAVAFFPAVLLILVLWLLGALVWFLTLGHCPTGLSRLASSMTAWIGGEEV